MKTVVGISQKIKRVWLDSVLDRLATTADAAELRSFLDKQLKTDLPGKESRAKSAGIILRVWSAISPEFVALRDRAVALLPRISGQERIWLHWGMTAIAYPFFRDTAEVVGRLLALQDDFTTSQVQGRMLTTWGDRATTKDATQKLITTLVEWEVLRSTKTKGHFLLARKMTASIPELQLWLLEALLAASPADEIEAQQLLRLPESFPFTIGVGVADLRRYEGFNIHRQGLDMDMVGLRKLKVVPPPKPVRKPKKEMRAKTVQLSLFDIPTEDPGLKNRTKNPNVVVAPSSPTPIDRPDSLTERRRIEDSLKKEVLRTLSDRVDRVVQVRGMNLALRGPFADPSTECVEQFRDGHYFGCIVLTRALLEAVIRHVWQVKIAKTPNRDGIFEKNLQALHKRKLISTERKVELEQMWAERYSLHHLRPSVELDRQKLEEMSQNMLKLLNKIEQEFFGATVQDGKVVPDHPEFWSSKETGH